MSRLYLGIDPGLGTTGYGLLSREESGLRLTEAGTITTRTSDPLPARLDELYQGLSEIIARFEPEVMGLEEVYSHYRHPRTAIIMAHARGVLCLAAIRAGVEVVALPATKIKKSITGNGRASKEQVRGMVEDLLGIREAISPLDVSDALAAAITAMEYSDNDRQH